MTSEHLGLSIVQATNAHCAKLTLLSAMQTAHL